MPPQYFEATTNLQALLAALVMILTALLGLWEFARWNRNRWFMIDLVIAMFAVNGVAWAISTDATTYYVVSVITTIALVFIYIEWFWFITSPIPSLVQAEVEL